MKIKGKYGEAIIYNEAVEDIALEQIGALMNHSVSEGAQVRIMPDVHAGAGCVIGYTSTLTDKVIPNLIGVDIGCGVLGFNIGSKKPDFAKLDDFIRKNIPSGFGIRSTSYDTQELFPSIDVSNAEIDDHAHFEQLITNVPYLAKEKQEHIFRSLGSLGGGNHFIEINKDNEENYHLVIHSGSRNFGLQIALHHQQIAENNFKPKIAKQQLDLKAVAEEAIASGKNVERAIRKAKKENKKFKWKPSGLEYLVGEEKEAYIRDMKLAQVYAKLNRRVMAEQMLNHLGFDFEQVDYVESVHNYIDFSDNIVRKGAISAHKGEQVLIPLNMAAGTIIGVGKGKKEWNFSAAHGAGRKMSRRNAVKSISMEEFRASMGDVWTTSVNEDTLDEAPQAYKDAGEIIEYLKGTVKVKSHMKPVYNFKAVAPPKKKKK